MSVWAEVVVASEWVTMTFAAPLSAADARGTCAEAVLGVSSRWDFDESRRVILYGTQRGVIDTKRVFVYLIKCT